MSGGANNPLSFISNSMHWKRVNAVCTSSAGRLLITPSQPPPPPSTFQLTSFAGFRSVITLGRPVFSRQGCHCGHGATPAETRRQVSVITKPEWRLNDSYINRIWRFGTIPAEWIWRPSMYDRRRRGVPSINVPRRRVSLD